MQTHRVALAFAAACGLAVSGPAAAQAAPRPITTTDCSAGANAQNVRTGAWNQKVTVSTCVRVTTYFDGRARPYHVTASTRVANRGVRPMRRLRTTTGVRKGAGTWYSHLSARDRLGRTSYAGVLVGSSSHSYAHGSVCTHWYGDSFLTFRVYFRGEGWRYYKAHDAATNGPPKSVC